MSKLTPQTEANAFRIWQYANPRGWDVTRKQIASHTGLSQGDVQHVIRAKGWSGRIQAANKDSGRYRDQRVVSGHLRAMQHGEDFDENMLDITQIMGI